MAKIEIEPQGEGCYSLNGELSFATVPSALTMYRDMTGDETLLRIDLKGVTRSDSAGVALLVEWMRSAKNNKKGIVFRNIPPQMLAVVQVSGLDHILPLERA